MAGQIILKNIKIVKKNLGVRDRIFRLIGAGFLILLSLTASMSLPEYILVWIVAIILILTATVGICPAYTLFGINTRKGQEQTRLRR